MLKEIDALVFDIQDVGARFYTYTSTLGLALEAAAKYKKSFVVLDRVNPINGQDVEGPLADADELSFTAHHPIPVRHGMTVGELALLFNKERNINADLSVVRVEDWRRSQWFDSTGLVDQSLTQHAQPDRGDPLSRRLPARTDQRLGGARNRHAV